LKVRMAGTKRTASPMPPGRIKSNLRGEWGKTLVRDREAQHRANIEPTSPSIFFRNNVLKSAHPIQTLSFGLPTID
jgi:hypothetical protein